MNEALSFVVDEHKDIIIFTNCIMQNAQQEVVVNDAEWKSFVPCHY